MVACGGGDEVKSPHPALTAVMAGRLLLLVGYNFRADLRNNVTTSKLQAKYDDRFFIS